MAKPFDWDLVRSFLAVARSGKLTVAARKMRIDHSTLSRRISALEESLNARLFDRALTGYTLTAEGERLLARAEAMESSVIAIQNDIAGENSQVSGTVRIGAPDGFGSMFLAPRIGDLAAAHPDLDIELVATPRSFSLSKREADIAIGLSEPPHGRLHARKLTDYELGLYGASHDDALHHDLSSTEDLAGRRFVSYIDDLIFTPELDYLPQIGKAIAPRLRSSNLLAQVEATAAGAGLCILPHFIAAGDRRLVRLLPQEIRLVRSFWMNIHADMRELARVKVTAAFIAGLVRRSAALFLPPT